MGYLKATSFSIFIFLTLLAVQAQDQAELTPQQIRASINARIMQVKTKFESFKKIENACIPVNEHKIPIRRYIPEGSGPFPVLVYFHGAGFVAGNLDTHDNVCRTLAKKVNCIVISVEYRLAPESKFPAAIEDCYAATVWTATNIKQFNGDPKRIAVGGDSAGGNLAAAVCLMSRERDGPKLIFQLLVNPALDFTAHDDFEQGRWFRAQYLRNEKDYKNPYASPLLAESLKKLPPAFIITGELDLPIRKEGEAYCKRLNDAGVLSNVYCQKNMGHLAGFWARASEEAQEALDLSIAVLKNVFKK